MRHTPSLLIALALTLPAAASAAKSGLEVGGFFKYATLYADHSDDLNVLNNDAEEDGMSAVHQLRFDAKAWIEAIELRLSIHGEAAWSEGVDNRPSPQTYVIQPTPTALRGYDLDRSAEAGPLTLRNRHVFLDRLSIGYQTKPLRITLGRQEITHGEARLFPSVDLFGPWRGDHLDRDVKRGVDALRIIIARLGGLEVEGIVAAYDAGADVEEVDAPLYLLRLGGKALGAEADFFVGYTYEAPTFGAALRRGAGRATWFLEVMSRPTLEEDVAGGTRGVAGVNYKRGRFELDAEGHYNGGSARARQAGEVWADEGAHLGLEARYHHRKWLNPSAAWLQRLDGDARLLKLGLSWAVWRRAHFDLAGLFPGGDAERLKSYLLHLRVYF